jgi:hypothetical protein
LTISRPHIVYFSDGDYEYEPDDRETPFCPELGCDGQLMWSAEEGLLVCNVCDAGFEPGEDFNL